MQTWCCRIPQPPELILKGCDSDNAILRHHFKTVNEWTKLNIKHIRFSSCSWIRSQISISFPLIIPVCSLLLWLTFKHLSDNLIWIFCKIENCFCAIFCDGTQTEILLTWSMPPPQLRQSRQTRVGSHTSATCPPASRSTCAAMFMCHKMFAVLGLSLVFLVKLRYRGMSQNDQLSLH